MLEERLYKHLELLVKRYPELKSIELDIINAYLVLENCYKNKGKILIAGNGGSAADAEHIVGELMKSFKLPRHVDCDLKNSLTKIDKDMGKILVDNLQKALPAIALDGHVSLTTAYMNDCAPLLCFAQQVNGYGKSKDVFVALSTSGNSENIIYAAITAKAKDMKIVGFTGSKNSRLSELADVCIKVPETETYMIQEYHLPIYHCLCLMLEEKFFNY